ncbi:hypothetical protein D3C80_2139920 [compost metagenome]
MQPFFALNTWPYRPELAFAPLQRRLDVGLLQNQLPLTAHHPRKSIELQIKAGQGQAADHKEQQDQRKR